MFLPGESHEYKVQDPQATVHEVTKSGTRLNDYARMSSTLGIASTQLQ